MGSIRITEEMQRARCGVLNMCVVMTEPYLLVISDLV